MAVRWEGVGMVSPEASQLDKGAEVPGEMAGVARRSLTAGGWVWLSASWAILEPLARVHHGSKRETSLILKRSFKN